MDEARLPLWAGAEKSEGTALCREEEETHPRCTRCARRKANGGLQEWHRMDERWVEAIARKMRTEKLVGENLGKASCSLQTTLDSTSGQCYSIMMS